MKAIKFFHALHKQIGAMRLYALPLAVTVSLQNCFLQAYTLCAPPLNIPRPTPGCWST